jgi:hypothetical protein
MLLRCSLVWPGSFGRSKGSWFVQECLLHFSLCERSVSVAIPLIWVVKYEMMGRGYITSSCSIRMTCFPAIRSCHSGFLDFQFTSNPSLVETMILSGHWWAGWLDGRVLDLDNEIIGT